MFKKCMQFIANAAMVALAFASAQAQADKLAEILSKGVVRIIVFSDVPPFSSTNVKRELEGFDVDLAKKNPNKEFDYKFALRRAPGHVTVKLGEHNLLRWLDTFIFQTTLTGDLNKLHIKWLGGPMTAPLPPL